MINTKAMVISVSSGARGVVESVPRGECPGTPVRLCVCVKGVIKGPCQGEG